MRNGFFGSVTDLDLRGIAEASARRTVRGKQSAVATEQAGPSESDLSTPGGELLGAQFVAARNGALQVEARHIGGAFLSFATVESVHVAYLATGLLNPLERILPLLLVLCGTLIGVMP